MIKSLKNFLVLLVSLGFISHALAYDLSSYYYNLSDRFMFRFDESLQAFGRIKDLEIESHDAQENREKQLADILSNVAEDHPLILNLVDPADAGRVIDHIKQHHNRVVFFNRKPSQKVLDSYKYAWYVGTDGNACGRYLFDIIKDYLDANPNYDKNQNGILDIIILQGEKGHPDTINRTSQILGLFKEHNISINVISKNYDNWSFDRGYEDTKKQIEKVGILNVDMIISNNDSMALGALKYLNSQNYNLDNDVLNPARPYIPLFGVDGIPHAIRAIREGKLTGSVYADFSALAKVCIDIALSDLTDDKSLSRKIWFDVRNKSVTIPYIRLSSFKDYTSKSYPVSNSN